MKLKTEDGKEYEGKIWYPTNTDLTGWGMPQSFRNFLKTHCGPATNALALKREGGIVVGLFRFNLDYVGLDDARTCVLRAAGTWVDPEFRRQGVASMLWRSVIENLHPLPGGVKHFRIACVPVTRAGAKFMEAMVREHGPAVFGAGL